MSCDPHVDNAQVVRSHAERDVAAPVCLTRDGKPDPAEGHEVALPRCLHQIHLRGADERRDIDGLRLREDFARSANLDDAAVVEHRDAIGKRHRFFLVVRDVHRGRAECALQRVQLDSRLEPQLRIEVRQRLVEKEETWLSNDGAGEGASLLLAARQLPRCAREQVCDADLLRGGCDCLFDRVRRSAHHLQREPDVLRNRHVRIERVALEHHRHVALTRLLRCHVDTVHVHVAFAHCLEPREDAQRGRLARPRRSEEDEEFAGLDHQVDAMQHGGGAVALDDALESHAAAQLCGAHRGPSCGSRVETALIADLRP